jgi:hypothetical protein
MPKVVINRCYGGFGLSTAAMIAYCEKKYGEFCIFNHKYGEFARKITYEEALKVNRPGNVFFYKKDNTTKPDTLPSNVNDNSIYDGDFDRADPILISVIEKLGLQKSSGPYSCLEIVDVPDDALWHVEDYDGMEHIAEDHRCWY